MCGAVKKNHYLFQIKFKTFGTITLHTLDTGEELLRLYLIPEITVLAVLKFKTVLWRGYYLPFVPDLRKLSHCIFSGQYYSCSLNLIIYLA